MDETVAEVLLVADEFTVTTTLGATVKPNEVKSTVVVAPKLLEVPLAIISGTRASQ
jgi:hypothetical protein